MGETDLISRQEAIDELIAMREHIESRMSVIGCTAYEMAIEALREPERATGKWIPCSERLPEEYGEYLITWETSKAPTRFIGFAEGEETGVWDDQHDRFVFSWLPEDYIIERYPDWRVIAWMPLPEPYKEGTDNQITACPMCPDCPDNCPLGEDMRGDDHEND